jgi:hypothetical protein
VTADLTRNSFDPAKYFSRVLMQQGRVQLDADWNEQAAILLHLIGRLAVDLRGPAWSPNGGFIPKSFSVGAAKVANDVIIPEGSFYVDGILCQIEATPVAILDWGNPTAASTTITVAQWTVDSVSFAIDQYLQLSDDSGGTAERQICRITGLSHSDMELTIAGADLAALAMSKTGRVRRLVTYLKQPYWPAPAALASNTLLYLDVWEREITSIEDDRIGEVALNGVDTAARTKVIWQVKGTTATKGQPHMTPASIARSPRAGAGACCGPVCSRPPFRRVLT